MQQKISPISQHVLNYLELCGYKSSEWNNGFFRTKFFQQLEVQYEHNIFGMNGDDLCVLGLMHQYGIGTKIDLERSEAIFQRAVKNGHGLSCEILFNLGLEYINKRDQINIRHGLSLVLYVEDKLPKAAEYMKQIRELKEAKTSCSHPLECKEQTGEESGQEDVKEESPLLASDNCIADYKDVTFFSQEQPKKEKSSCCPFKCTLL